jgi:capsular polysaccharide biosynthesis protein
MLSPTTATNPPLLDDPEELSYRVFEPPSDQMLSSLARNKVLILACAIVIAIAGVAFGLSRQRTFTASATLQVGQVNPNSPGFYSYVASAEALATAFSRAVTAEPVLATIEQKLKLPPEKAAARLSAEPIPQSPVFRVIATGPSETDATRLANVTAAAVTEYESRSNSANPEAGSLLHEYSAASLALERARAKLSELESTTRAAAKGKSNASAFAAAKSARDTAQTRLNAIAAAYTAAVTSQAPRSGLVSLVAGATSASDNRKSKVEAYGLIGLLVGVLAGCLLAVARDRRRHTATFPASLKGPASEPPQV